MDATHYEIHSRKVVSGLLQLLGVIGNLVFCEILADATTDIKQQRARAACRVIDGDSVFMAEMVSNNLRHHKSDLMRSVELTGFLTCVCGEVGDKIFVDEAENVVVLATVGRNIFDKLEQVVDGFGLCSGAFTEFAQAVLQSIEDTFVNFLMRGANKPSEAVERISNVSNTEVRIRSNPSREQIGIGYEIAEIVLALLNGFGHFIFIKIFLDGLVGPIIFFEELDLGIRQELIEDKAEYIILILVSFNLRAHLVCRSPYFRCKLLLVHGSISFKSCKGRIKGEDWRVV